MWFIDYSAIIDDLHVKGRFLLQPAQGQSLVVNSVATIELSSTALQ